MPEGGGGGYVLKTVSYGQAPPRDPTTYPFIYHFWKKKYPLRIPSTDKSLPLHIPRLELCIPKCAVFEM